MWAYPKRVYEFFSHHLIKVRSHPRSPSLGGKGEHFSPLHFGEGPGEGFEETPHTHQVKEIFRVLVRAKALN